jgi:hypothetical protein
MNCNVILDKLSSQILFQRSQVLAVLKSSSSSRIEIIVVDFFIRVDNLTYLKY